MVPRKFRPLHLCKGFFYFASKPIVKRVGASVEGESVNKFLKKKLLLWFVVVCLCSAALSIWMLRSQLAKLVSVKFEDAKMEETIRKIIRVKDNEVLSKEELEDVEWINIGYTQLYDTLSDIKKCNEIDDLVIGDPNFAVCSYPYDYLLNPKTMTPESPERVEQIQAELKEILDNNQQDMTLRINNEDELLPLTDMYFVKDATHLTGLTLENYHNIDFSAIYENSHITYLRMTDCSVDDLQNVEQMQNLTTLSFSHTTGDFSTVSNCENLERLSLEYCDLSEVGDLSGLENLISVSLNGSDGLDMEKLGEMANVKVLDLEYTDIADVDELIKMKNLELLYIKGTPLAENPQELRRLWEALPEIDIDL